MRDVARAAGVSVAVVSYCFNHPERVASVTRERVLATARSLDYTGANAAARALSTRRTGVIGLVCGRENRSPLDDLPDIQIARGVANVCTQEGLSLLLAPRTGSPMDGLIVVGDHPDPPLHPVVYIHDAAGRGDAPHVACDLDTGIRDVASLLTALGHRSIAVLGYPGDGERRAAAARHLGTADALTVYEATSRRHSEGHLAARAALAAPARPTAVIGLSGDLASGAFDLCLRLGLRVPGDVSVVGVDDTPDAAALGITSVAVPHRETGEIAMGLLRAALRGQPAPRVPRLPAPLIVRASTGPVAGS